MAAADRARLECPDRIAGVHADETVRCGDVAAGRAADELARRGVDLAGLICHNDAGSQYTSIAYTDALADIEARPSIGTVGDSYDNAMAESVNALYKTELHRNPAVLAAHGGHWKGLDDLEIATSGWVAWFNEERLHGELYDATRALIPEDVFGWLADTQPQQLAKVLKPTDSPASSPSG